MNGLSSKPYRGYTPNIHWDEEGGCFLGEIDGLHMHIVIFGGDTEEEVRKKFEQSVDFYLEIEECPEKPFGNPFLLPVNTTGCFLSL